MISIDNEVISGETNVCIFVRYIKHSNIICTFVAFNLQLSTKWVCVNAIIFHEYPGKSISRKEIWQIEACNAIT